MLTREWIRRQAVSTKLVMVSGAAALALLCIAFAAIHFARSTSAAADRVYREGILGLLAATRLELALERHRRIVESAPAEFDRTVLASDLKQLGQLDEQLITEIAAAGETLNAPANNGITLEILVKQLIQSGRRTMKLAESFAQDSAYASAQEYERLATSLDQRVTEYMKQRTSIISLEVKNLSKSAGRLERWINSSILVLLLVLAPIAGYIVSDVFSRLARMHSVVRELSNDRFEGVVPFLADRDEIGELARALDVFKLKSVALREAKAKLKQHNTELAALSGSLEVRVVARTAETEEAVKAAQRANAELTCEVALKTQIEGELRATNDKLLNATNAKTQFLANMSHEIRTPMNGVLGMTDLLIHSELNERQRKLAGAISVSAHSLLEIINDILDITRIEGGNLEINPHEFGLGANIEGIIELLAGQAHKKGVNLLLSIDKNVYGTVTTDSVRLRQVLVNLIGNAIKFTSRGSVKVSVAAETVSGENHVRFTVVDTGIGIDAAAQSKLFQPFTQADSSIARRFGGTGLGLSISRHLVEMLGGSMEFESELGKGTSVSFALPLEVSFENDAFNAGDIAGRRVLIVDENHVNRDLICSYLTEAGAVVEVAENAEAGLLRLAAGAMEQAPFALAIVDVGNDGIDGVEFGKRARALLDVADLQLIMLSSISSDGDLAPLLEAGVERLLYKPVRRAELIAALTDCFSTAPASVVAVAKPSTASVSGRSLGLYVLVADDSSINQFLAEEFLSNLGCTVSIVENGAQAVAAATRETFDVILMDGQMPEMDGYAAARAIRKFERAQGLPATPIIALTANAFESDRKRSLESGMNGYLSKPYSEKELADTLVGCNIRARAQIGAERPIDLSNTRASERAATQSSEVVSQPEMQLCVLLAEDNPTSAHVATEILTDAGHTVFHAANGKQAVALAADTRFDIIFMDISMPEMGGVEATSLIRSSGPPNATTPIVALTAHAFSGDDEKIADWQMNGCLTKPVKKATLLKALSCHASEVTVTKSSDQGGVIDMASFAGFARDRRIERVVEALKIFIAELEQTATSLTEVVAAKDRAALQMLAHSSIGSGSMLGAARMVELSRLIELCCKTGEPIEWAAAGKLLETVRETAMAYKKFDDRDAIERLRNDQALAA